MGRREKLAWCYKSNGKHCHCLDLVDPRPSNPCETRDFFLFFFYDFTFLICYVYSYFELELFLYLFHHKKIIFWVGFTFAFFVGELRADHHADYDCRVAARAEHYLHVTRRPPDDLVQPCP